MADVSADVAEDALRDLLVRLRNMDTRSRKGPWTGATLALIDANPRVAASRLAPQLGLETAPFKSNVRKLKALGLTLSHDQTQRQGHRLHPDLPRRPRAQGGSSMKEHGRELIPRKTLFGNPERTAVTISHDGTRIAYLAPLDGVLNVWVAPLEAIERASPVTRDQGRGIRSYSGPTIPGSSCTCRTVTATRTGTSSPPTSRPGTARDLIPYDGVQANLQETSDKFPEEVLIRLNRRDPSVHDLYRVNILTGAAHLVARNDIGADRFVTDRNFNPRLAVVIPPDGGTRVLALSKSGRWEPFMTIGAEDSLTTQPLCFDADGHTLYLLDSRGRDTSALVAMDLEAETERELARHPRADAAGGGDDHRRVGRHPAAALPRGCPARPGRAEPPSRSL